MKHIAFSWGYWGWESHTREFVRAVDAVERSRGMRPPVFADVRFSRSVRAVGFRDAAFEEVVGTGRYRWLRKLGNSRIGAGASGIRIADPSGAEDLSAARQELREFCGAQGGSHCAGTQLS